MTDEQKLIDSIEGEMTPEQVAQLIGMGEGDTEESETGSAPEAAPAKGETEPKVEEGNAGDAKAGDAANAETETAAKAVSARDGVHIIPYEKLEEARHDAKHWKQEAEANRRELEELRAQAAAREAAGEAPTEMDNQAAIAQSAIDQGVDPDIFGDFSEEAMAAGIAKLTKELVEARIAPLEQQLAPMKQQHEQDAIEAHYAAIHAKHPDASSIYESVQLADWINAQPSFVRDGYKAVLESGTTDQIIELFDSFKQANGVATPANQDVKTAAKAAIDQLEEQVPASLSDVPGGRASASSREEAMAGMDGIELIAAMDDMTPEQIERHLNSL